MRKTGIVISAISLFISIIGGCIPLEGLGPYWDKGFIDEKLIGHWKSIGSVHISEDKYMSFIKNGDHYELKNVDIGLSMEEVPDYVCKSLTIGKQTFLMIDLEECEKRINELRIKEIKKESADEVEVNIPKQPSFGFKGILIRYVINDDKLIFYNFFLRKLSEVVKDGKLKGTINKSDKAMFPVILGQLDESILKFIAGTEGNITWWQKAATYERITDINEAIKQSQTYPATEETPANTLVDINIPEMKYFAEGKTGVLLRILETMSEWEVEPEFTDSGDIIANRYISNFGTDQNQQDDYKIHFIFRFSKEPYGYQPKFAKQPHVMKVSPTVGKINIKLQKNWQGIESYIAIGQEGLWFEFFEQSQKEPRVYTRQAIAWLTQFLKDALAAEKEIQTKGYIKKLTDPNTIRTGKASLEIIEDLQTLKLKAWINPQEQGYVYSKVIDTNSDQAFDVNQIYQGSKKYIGFSQDPNCLFLYSYSLQYYFKKSFDASIEVWFHPSNGTSDRLLIASKRKIISAHARTIDYSKHGKVKDNENNPVDNAEVILFGVDKLEFPYSCKSLDVTHTDSNGEFDLTYKQPYISQGQRWLFIVAVKKGYSYGSAIFNQYTKDNIFITMGKSTTIAGKIVNKKGVPIKNAHVYVLRFSMTALFLLKFNVSIVRCPYSGIYFYMETGYGLRTNCEFSACTGGTAG